MTDKTEPAVAPAPAPAPEPAKADHGKTATLILATGEVQWLPSRKSAALVTDGEARRATERDLRVAGVPLEPPA